MTRLRQPLPIESISASGASKYDALRDEIVRLREDNEDLRASANWWLLLYEAALGRANGFEEWLSSPEEVRRGTAERFAIWLSAQGGGDVEKDPVSERIRARIKAALRDSLPQ